MEFTVVCKRDRLLAKQAGKETGNNPSEDKWSVKSENKKNAKSEIKKKLQPGNERSIKQGEKKKGSIHLFCNTGIIVSLWSNTNSPVEKIFIVFLSSKLRHPPTSAERKQYFLAHSFAPKEPIPLDKPISECNFSPNEMVLRTLLFPFPFSCPKGKPLDAIYIMRGVSPEPFSVTLFGSAPMETVYERYLEHFLGHKPNKQEMRGHVLVRSVSPAFILPRDCRLSESDVQNGDVLEGSGKRLT